MNNKITFNFIVRLTYHIMFCLSRLMLRKTLQNRKLFYTSSDKLSMSSINLKSIWLSNCFNYQQFSTINSRQTSQLSQSQIKVQKGFLSLYTFYFITQINNDKLYEETEGKNLNDTFDTIRQRLLKQKVRFYKEDGLDPKVIDQFFAAFQMGKGVKLNQQIFTNQRIHDGKLACERKSVFNITSITQKVFRFAKTNNQVLVGNSGIGKTWSHACLNYLSSMVLKCLICDEGLKKIKALIDLYFEQFVAIHKQNNDKQEQRFTTRESILQEFKTFPIQLFIQLRKDLTWEDLVYNLHSQFPQIKLPQLEQLPLEYGQSQRSYMIMLQDHKRIWAQDFFTNMSNTFKSYKKLHYSNIKFVVNVDQANIYYGNLRDIVSLFQRKQILNLKKILSLSDQDELVRIKKQIESKYDLHYHLQNIFNVMYLKINRYIKLNCSDQVQLDIVARQYRLLSQQLKTFEDFSKYQQNGQVQINYGMDETSRLGLKQMWSLLWFQIQRRIFLVNSRFQNKIQNKELEMVLKQIQLRNLFNKLFQKRNYYEDRFYGYQFFIQLYSLRLTLRDKVLNNLHIYELLYLIQQYQSIKDQNEIFQKQKKQQYKLIMYEQFQILVRNYLNESINKDLTIPFRQLNKLFITNSSAKQQQENIYKHQWRQ